MADQNENTNVNETADVETTVNHDASQSNEQGTAVTLEELTKRVNELSEQLERQKQATNNAASDAANWKKKFRDTQTEAERQEADRQEAEKKKDDLIKSLTREKEVSTFKASFIGLGYGDADAQSAAEALLDGKNTDVVNSFKSFITAHDQSVKEQSMNNQPELSKGLPPTNGSVESKAVEAFRNAVNGRHHF